MEDPLNTEEQTKVELEWNRDSAELAYSVIARYVEHTQVSGIIIALMASAVGEEKSNPLPTANTGRVIWPANARLPRQSSMSID
ncbi:MAG: hypothetical protein IPG76_15375 [Acidobacteria bacterium]|nr:hypothetical protein [Acidobacteriota bacterium]